MIELATLNTAAYPPGVYRVNRRIPPSAILSTLTDWDWYAGYINGSEVHDKRTFLTAVGQAFAFPDYAGRNWDAFEELINDLSWVRATGYALIYDEAYRFAATNREEWGIALAILTQAAANWQREEIPFYTLLRRNWQWNRQLPMLPT
jgi:RNAse (barnase) inhibitor barstar